MIIINKKKNPKIVSILIGIIYMLIKVTNYSAKKKTTLLQYN